MNVNNEITIITAFFEIDRNKIKGFERTDNQYLEYFKEWARLKNRVVIFCEEFHKEKIYNIRKYYGLEEKTNIIVINDLKSLDIELYHSISNAMKSPFLKNYMYYNQNPEVINKEYNFLMCIKPLLVKRGIELLGIKGNIAWLDFGFNNNKIHYKNMEEFNFLWEYNFDKEKIHLFNLKEIDNIPIFEIIKRMDSYIQGGTLIADSRLWGKFWELVRGNMIILNKIGLADDDQILYLMSYKIEGELFELHKANWNEPIKLFGGEHLTYNYIKDIKKKSFKSICVNQYIKYMNFIQKTKYCIRVFKGFNNEV